MSDYYQRFPETRGMLRGKLWGATGTPFPDPPPVRWNRSNIVGEYYY